MAQQDNRNRQRGSSQQEAYSQQNRQQGWHESARQPQGDYGDTGSSYRGSPSGGSSDWRRSQDDRGGYRDDSAWRSRSDQDLYGQRGYGGSYGGGYDQDRYSQGGSYGGSDYGDQGREYGQYGLRDRDDGRYGQYGPSSQFGGYGSGYGSNQGYGQERDRQGRYSSGMDRDYRGAGYAGPGGYGGGMGGGYSGPQSGYSGYGNDAGEHQHFDPDYSQWRREQMRSLDDDYGQWRQDRFKKFSDEFSTWRSNRNQQAGAGKQEAGSTPGKSHKDNT